MMRSKNFNLIKFFWSFVILIELGHEQAYALICPIEYQCVEGKDTYVWVNEKANKHVAQKYCTNRGMSLLGPTSPGPLTLRLVEFTPFFNEYTYVWLAAKFYSTFNEYRWDDNNFHLSFNGSDQDVGECVVLKPQTSKLVSANCEEHNDIICMQSKTRWFGENRKFRCNCRTGGCSYNGQCLDTDSKCALGWFGESCQMSDAQLDISKNLYDFDDSTCEENLSSPLDVFLSTAQYFSWIRIVSRDDGRNVALKENSELYSGTLEDPARYVVDGERGILTIGAPIPLNNETQHWFLELGSNRIVFEVVIYIKHPNDYVMSGNTFTLDFLNSNLADIRRNNAGNYTFSTDSSRFSILSGTTETVKYVRISLEPTNRRNKHLDLSEVEIYGSCVPPYRGLYCNITCPLVYEGDTCHYDGDCKISVHESTPSTTTTTQSTTTFFSTSTTSSKITVKTSPTTKKRLPPFQCPLGFFGKQCQFVCHCKDNLCRRDGECTQGNSCKDGWFALACQYNDLAKGSNSSDPLLTDNDDSTCYIPPKNVISANLEEPFVYTWIRVVFRGYDSEECKDLRVVSEQTNQFDIFCSNEIVTTYVEISWQGNGSVCSLYINGGRNVAIESYISTFKGETTFENNPLKDGITTATACLHFPSEENKTLTFRYNDLQTVTRIIVYTDMKEKDSFILQGTFAKDDVVFRYKSLQGTRHIVYLSKRKMSTVSNVTFQVIEGSINVCEIEIYGDCAPPHFYLDCSETCILTCYKYLCHYNGFCFNCRHGRQGTHCMEASRNETNPWIEQEDVQKEQPKKIQKQKQNFSIFLYLSLPIIGLACFTYNVLDLYQREQHLDKEKISISTLRKSTVGRFSNRSELFEEEAEDVESFKEMHSPSHSVDNLFGATSIA